MNTTRVQSAVVLSEEAAACPLRHYKIVSKPLLRRKQGQTLEVGEEIPEFHSG